MEWEGGEDKLRNSVRREQSFTLHVAGTDCTLTNPTQNKALIMQIPFKRHLQNHKSAQTQPQQLHGIFLTSGLSIR